MQTDKTTLTVKEAADLAERSPTTIKRYCRARLFEARQLTDRGDWRINRESFYRFIGQAEKSTESTISTM